MDFIAGLVLGLSLIVAIGAQNVFVLRQGLRRDRVWLVVAICALSDLVLIGAGVGGLGLAVEALPWLETGARWAGAAFLVVYGALAARRAFVGDDAALAAGETLASRSPWLTVAGTALALTWLNPHVYLDTVFLLGSIASSHGEGRWKFAAGAGVASIVWFTVLGFGARLLSRTLTRPLAWRILDAAIAIVMWAIAARLALGY